MKIPQRCDVGPKREIFMRGKNLHVRTFFFIFTLKSVYFTLINPVL